MKNQNYQHDKFSPDDEKAVQSITTVLVDTFRLPPTSDPQEGLNKSIAIEHAIKDLVIAVKNDCKVSDSND